MFIGHYGPAFGARAATRLVPLWLLFIAVQWLDICWSSLVFAGVEKLRIVPGFTEASPLDLYYMPFSHGLLGAIALSLLLGAASALVIHRRRLMVFLIVAGAGFSHWLLDLLVHIQDLPLWGDRYKVGFGLWRHMWLSLLLELAVLALGGVAYARRPGAPPAETPWLVGFLALLAVFQLYAKFRPPPASPQAAAIASLVGYIVLAALAATFDVRNWRHSRKAQ